jgi:hypothetical protein
MHDVTVRNCHVDGFLNSFRATRVGFHDLAAGHEYDDALSDVVLERSTLSNSRGVGAYVDGYVSRVTLRDLTITGAGSSGIYLEAGSRQNVVERNRVIDNGFRENGPNGQLFSFGGHTFRFWGPGREGLSIDGSYDNVVRRNRFEGNSAGGIFLYTNCSEDQHDPQRWFQRRTKAERNVVELNRFVGGRNGVWVGSRMSENTLPMDCSNPAYREGPVERVTLDYAPGNVVRLNSFEGVRYAVRVEDDGTRVVANRFTGPDATSYAVVVGTKWRGPVLGRPVTGTVVTDNVATIVGNASPYRWAYGIGPLDAARNVSSGAPAAFCEGAPVPTTAFIFVIVIALEDPGMPVATRPPGDLGDIGAQPSC